LTAGLLPQVDADQVTPFSIPAKVGMDVQSAALFSLSLHQQRLEYFFFIFCFFLNLFVPVLILSFTTFGGACMICYIILSLLLVRFEFLFYFLYSFYSNKKMQIYRSLETNDEACEVEQVMGNMLVLMRKQYPKNSYTIHKEEDVRFPGNSQMSSDPQDYATLGPASAPPAKRRKVQGTSD